MPLRDLLTARREKLALTKDFGAARPITLHQTGAISVRDRTTPYKGANYAAEPGDIVFSKIDARLGAVGVIPDGFGQAVVTTEFPVFTPDPQKLDRNFAGLILRTPSFLDALRAKASGTSGRKRVSPAAFLDLRVPLPPLSDQLKLVSEHRGALISALELEGEADATEAAAHATFDEALGITPSEAPEPKPVFVARFADLERWSHEGIQHRQTTDETSIPHWPTMRLADVVADLENGWSPKCLDRPAQDTEWGVLKLGAVSFGAFDEHENKALPDGLTPRPRLEIEPGQVLISRANVTRLVGATALVGETRERLMLCDKIFRVVPHPDAPATPAFITNVLRTSHVRAQIEGKLTGTSPTMKNISKPALLGLTFPVPPLPVQKSLVARLTAALDQAVQLRGEARELRKAADLAFYRAIYPADEAPLAQAA